MLIAAVECKRREKGKLSDVGGVLSRKVTMESKISRAARVRGLGVNTKNC